MLLECILNDKIVPINVIKQISIRESIYSPIIEGEIDFFDIDLVDYNIIKEKKEYQISFLVYDITKDQENLLTFMLTKIDSGTVQTENFITLEFTSWFSTEIYTKPHSTYYEDLEISKIISRLLKFVNVDMQFVLTTSNKLTTVLPYWSIYTSLKYLVRKCIDGNNRAGYLLFPDLFTQKMNLVNFNYLYNGNLLTYELPLIKSGQNDEYVGTVESIDFLKEYDLLDDLESGIGKTQFQTFNLNNGKVETTNKLAKDILKTENASNKDLLINDEFLNENYLKKQYVPFSEIDELRIDLDNRYYNLINEMFVLNIDVPGDYNRKLGSMLTLLNYKYDSNGLVTDKRISDVYLIKEIEHIITQKMYKQNLNLIKSGIQL